MKKGLLGIGAVLILSVLLFQLWDQQQRNRVTSLRGLRGKLAKVKNYEELTALLGEPMTKTRIDGKVLCHYITRSDVRTDQMGMSRAEGLIVWLEDERVIYCAEHSDLGPGHFEQAYPKEIVRKVYIDHRGPLKPKRE